MNQEPRAVLDLSDTIVAQATVSGRGALAVVRLSGPDAHRIAAAVLSRWPQQARNAELSIVRDASGAELDQSIVIRYDAPASYTGEHAVELITHGGALVPTTVVAALIAQGARQALPGEFTRRAVLNGKLDVLQAEATGDLVAATSRAAQRVAISQLDGGLSRRVSALREELLGLEALIAYDIDFPEEDDGPIAPARIQVATEGLIESMQRLLATAHAGEVIREGALVVLAGEPNVGKSSLFNALLGQARAIVTDIPGTTRDAIEAVIDTPAWPLRLVDTAGLRETVDPVERLGVEVSAAYLARAAVVLACGDSVESLEHVVDVISVHSQAPVLRVRTKADLADDGWPVEVRGARPTNPAHTPPREIHVSAETGEGLVELLDAITRVVTEDAGEVDADAPILTHTRQRFAIERALGELDSFRRAWCSDAVPATVAAVHLREAVAVLEELIGAVEIEDVLDEVFRRFCVGK